MEQASSRLASLTLILKYYPVANYSYPRYEIIPRSDRRSSVDRSLYESEGSTPDFFDDRSDSEASADDDYQYHAHASELWHSFWE